MMNLVGVQWESVLSADRLTLYVYHTSGKRNLVQRNAVGRKRLPNDRRMDRSGRASKCYQRRRQPSVRRTARSTNSRWSSGFADCASAEERKCVQRGCAHHHLFASLHFLRLGTHSLCLRLPCYESLVIAAHSLQNFFSFIDIMYRHQPGLHPSQYIICIPIGAFITTSRAREHLPSTTIQIVNDDE